MKWQQEKASVTDERWSDLCERQAMSTASAGAAARASIFEIDAVGFRRCATAGPAEDLGKARPVKGGAKGTSVWRAGPPASGLQARRA